MKFIKNLFFKTFIGKIVKTGIETHNYIKDYEYISDTLYSDAFKIVLKEYLGLEVRKDWIGRLYGVINPNIDVNGKFDISKTILEIDGDNTNNNEFIKHWTYKQLLIIGEVFKIDNLWHFINLEFKHVGPPEADNYLLVFDMVARRELAKQIKSTLLHGAIYGVITLITIGILMII